MSDFLNKRTKRNLIIISISTNFDHKHLPMSLISSLKNSVTNNLTINQTRLLRNIVEPPFLYSQLSKHSTLILGCQRSGTTLIYLILNAHPQVKGIDETETNYSFPHQSVLYNNSKNNYLTCLKLPNQTFNLKYIIQHFPQTKIIWPIRNPYKVVSSMRSFAIQGKAKQGNWLKFFAQQELLSLSDFFPEIKTWDLTNLDEVSLGAYIWKYKNYALEQYKETNLDVLVFKYEDLLDNSRKVIGEMLNFVGLNWDDIVFNHHKYYNDDAKRYPGGTRGARPINGSKKERQLNLSEREIELVTSICQEQMITYGYQNWQNS